MNGYRYYGWVNDRPARRLTPAVHALLCLIIGVYIVELLLPPLTRSRLYYWFALSVRGLRHGFLWQPFTYLFLHGGLLHIVLNGLALYFIGPATERAMGTRQFLILFFLSGLLGGLGWALITDSNAFCIGASGAVFGILGAFAALYPNEPLTVLLFFVIPVTLPAWIWALILAGGELIAMLRPETGGIAYAAHLAGGLAGYVYTSVVFCNGQPFRNLFRKFMQRGRTAGSSFLKESPPDAAEIDRLLDKVAREGFSSLTPSEREKLERAAEERRRRGG